MPNKPTSIRKHLQRGQGALEYALMILLVAVVAVPIVTVLVDPDDWRDGVIYQQIYLPILCAVQGRQDNCVENYVYDYPTKESGGGKNLGEGEGEGELGEGEDPNVLKVVSIEIVGQPDTNIEPGTYDVQVEVNGTPDNLSLSLERLPGNTAVGGWGGFQMGDGVNVTQTFTFTLPFTEAALGSFGDYEIVALATKNGDPATETLAINVDPANDPNDAANLYGAGFRIFDPATDAVVVAVQDEFPANTVIDYGRWELEGGTFGGDPAYVEMVMTGPVSRTVTDTTAPYTLYGDDVDPFIGTNLVEGEYTLQITPYDATDQAGTPSELYRFTVNPPPDPISVDSVQWVDVTGTVGTIEDTLTNGDTIIFENNVSFVANTTGPVESVRFELTRNGSGVDNLFDSAEPVYSMYGDSGGNFTGAALEPGDYTLTVTAYYEDAGQGGFSAPYTVNFTLDTGGPQVTEILLWDTSNNTSLGPLTPGMRLPVWSSITFEAVTNDETVSVEIRIVGTGSTSYSKTQSEGVEPFTAYGDSGYGNMGSHTFPDGTYRISVLPYDVPRNEQSSSIPGPSLSFDFVVAAGACPAYDTVLVTAGCSGSEWYQQLEISLWTTCGEATEVTIGAPLNVGVPESGNNYVKDWTENEQERTYWHRWWIDSNAVDLETLKSICTEAQPLSVRTIYGDGNIEDYTIVGGELIP